MTTADFDALPAVLNSAEAAAALRIGKKEVRGLIDRGELPATRLGPRRVIRVKKSAVLALLEGHGSATGNPAPGGTVGPCKSVRRWKGRRVQ
jgi:excisionase family DNA binding protein